MTWPYGWPRTTPGRRMSWSWTSEPLVSLSPRIPFSAYHGHLTSAMQVSPYMFDHGSSLPKPTWVHVAPTPDVYRGVHRLSDEDLQNGDRLKEAGEFYAAAVEKIIQEEIEGRERTVAGYMAEALQACGGQVIPPPGYFKRVGEYIRSHGGVMILDEVQTGFGRVGTKYWAHQLWEDGFVPDILTMGKPMGNGYPVSAVVTRKEIADALGGECEYFNTVGSLISGNFNVSMPVTRWPVLPSSR